jgi:hypothetical protein
MSDYPAKDLSNAELSRYVIEQQEAAAALYRDAHYYAHHTPTRNTSRLQEHAAHYARIARTTLLDLIARAL